METYCIPENKTIEGVANQNMAKIKKRKEAQRAYEQARDEGRKAALLEQDRPNFC